MEYFTRSISQNEHNRFITVICSALLVLYTIAIVEAYRNPAMNYEGSIYWSTPITYWISIFALFVFASFCVVVIQPKKQFLKKVFILLIVISFLLPSVAHIIRGYHSWGMTVDPATHLGFLNTIIQTGHFNSYDMFYPGLHIFTAEIFAFSGIDTRILTLFVPLFFSLLYLGGMYLLYREVLNSESGFNIAFLMGCALLSGSITLFTPNMVGNAFFPIVIYAIIKTCNNQSFSMSVPLIIFSIYMVVLYLLSAIAVIIAILSYGILYYMFQKMCAERYDISRFYSLRITTVVVTIMAVWLIYWLSFFRPWRILVLNLKYIIEDGFSIAHTTSTVEKVGYASDFGYDVIEIILRIYGPTILVLFLTLISFVFIWKEAYSGCENKAVFSLYGPIAGYIILCGILFLFNFNFGPLRFLPYINIIAPISIGCFLASWREKNSHLGESFKNICIILLILGLFAGCLLNHYTSPYVLQPNYQDTKAELDGSKWFFENGDMKYSISGVTFPPGRYAQALLTEDQKKIIDLPNYLRSNLDLSFAASKKEDSNAFQAPYHFGYQNSDSVAQYYDAKTYLVILERDLVYYKEQFVNLANDRWAPADFYRLRYDTGLDLIYSNTGFEVWVIMC